MAMTVPGSWGRTSATGRGAVRLRRWKRGCELACGGEKLPVGEDRAAWSAQSRPVGLLPGDRLQLEAEVVCGLGDARGGLSGH